MPSRVAAFAALVFLLAASAVLAGRINGPFLGKINGKASVSNQDGINSGNSTSASPVTFDLDPESSADNLTSSLTINSAAMTLVADYDARDASASSWPADTTGPTLTVAGSDDDPDGYTEVERSRAARVAVASAVNPRRQTPVALNTRYRRSS